MKIHSHFFILFASLILLTGVRGEASIFGDQKELNVLFIGNSFTARHNLSGLVKEVLEEGQPGLSVNVQALTYGGQDLFRHWTYFFSHSFIEQQDLSDETLRDRIEKMERFQELETTPSEYSDYWQAVRAPEHEQPFSIVQQRIGIALKRHQHLFNSRKHKWDVVVLQSWRDIVPEKDQGYSRYASKFAELAAEQGAQVVLYMTAPFVQNATPVDGPQLQNKVEMELQVVRNLARKIGATAVVPVPLAINNLQQGGTDLTFCYVNDFHPNQTTAYLTANMFYTAFTKQRSEGLSFDTVTENNSKGQPEGKDPDGGNATVVFEGETKMLLQQAAYEAVMQFDQSLENEMPEKQSQQRTNP